jgi:hypothetical protein
LALNQWVFRSKSNIFQLTDFFPIHQQIQLQRSRSILPDNFIVFDTEMYNVMLKGLRVCEELLEGHGGLSVSLIFITQESILSLKILLFLTVHVFGLIMAINTNTGVILHH